MNIRETMNNNPALVTIGAVVLLLICLGLIVRQLTGGGGGTTIDSLYYYDLNSGKIFTQPTDAIPPTDAPSGSPYNGEPAGVKAYIYACGECNSDYADMTLDQIKQSGAFVGYVEKYAPRAKQTLENSKNNTQASSPEAYYQTEQGRLIRPIQGEQWVQAMSQQGAQMEGQLYQQCPKDKPPKICYPGQ